MILFLENLSNFFFGGGNWGGLVFWLRGEVCRLDSTMTHSFLQT